MILNVNLNGEHLCSFEHTNTNIHGCCSEKMLTAGNHYRELHEVLLFFH